MTQETFAFFTLDRGTVATKASLIAPVDGRYRLLAAGAAPAGIDPEAILEDLAWRVARTDASVAGSMEGWQTWSRLEVRTQRVPRAVLVAASEATGALLERAFVAAGWSIRERFFGSDLDLIAFGEACLDPHVDALVMGGRDGVEEAEVEAAHQLWPRAGALARFRDDLALIACGPFAERPEGIPDVRLFSLPAPEPVPLTAESVLRVAAQQVGSHVLSRGEVMPADARVALAASMASLAGVLGHHVDGVEIGVAAGSRTIAAPDGGRRHALVAAAGLLPPELLDDDSLGEAILRWSTLPGDPATRLDALRELRLHPWTRLDEEGAHLRTAALRAALERLVATWSSAVPDGAADGAELLVLCGGAFTALPPAVSALVAVDAVRRTGAMSLLLDHAAVLAPLGALPVEEDRRRLLVDLMDDCLLPLGSALLAGSPTRDRGKAAGSMTLRISSTLGADEMQLDADGLRLVDLPPGIGAKLELETGEGSARQGEGQRLALEVRGGLAGLLVDTRGIPLELPAGGEQRRATLAEWEAPVWSGSER